MSFELEAVHIFYVSLVVSAVLFVEAGYLLLAPDNSARKHINRRMTASGKKKISQKDILVQLRKERGLDADGNFVLPMKWLNQLVVQAGITVGMPRVMMYWGGFFLVSSLVILFMSGSPGMALLASPVTGLLLPWFYLVRLRAKKMTLFGKQLPEAVDLITRSLKAGHPVPVSIAMVAREMPDPIGSEFGMVADEVTFGSDLVTALANMQSRVGHPDLPLLVSSVSIQSATGGNLREILDGLSKVVRARLKMKAKIRAISAEGRISAVFLSAMPVILFIVLLTLMPDYYSGVWEYSETWWGFSGLIFWLVAGNAMIMKMVSFKV